MHLESLLGVLTTFQRRRLDIHYAYIIQHTLKLRNTNYSFHLQIMKIPKVLITRKVQRVVSYKSHGLNNVSDELLGFLSFPKPWCDVK
jgi:hypothetical protein